MKLDVMSIPGMIESGECCDLMRATVGKKLAMDVGVFCGRSTMSLANAAERVIAVDPFLFPIGDEYEGYFRRLAGVPSGNSFRHVFNQHTALFKHKIEVIESRVEDFHYVGVQDIGVLHVDCSSELPLHQHVLATLFPRMEVGGYIMQQDFWWVRSWYLPALMHAYEKAGYIKWKGDVATTRSYEVVQKIPTNFKVTPTRDEFEAAIDGMTNLNFYNQDVQTCIKIFFHRVFGEMEQAQTLADAVARVALPTLQTNFEHACTGPIGAHYVR